MGFCKLIEEKRVKGKKEKREREREMGFVLCRQKRESRGLVIDRGSCIECGIIRGTEEERGGQRKTEGIV